MGRPQLTLLQGGQGDHPGDLPGDSPDALPDYREFLPQGDTRFGILDEENEAAFRAQFPELIPALDQLKKTIHEWQEIFKNLPSAAAKEQAGLLDWTLRIQSTTSQEVTNPMENLFKVTVQCVDSPASGFEHLQKVYDWTQRIPAMLQVIQREKEEAEPWYQKAAKAINEQLIEWALGENKPSLDPAKIEESVTILKQLPWRHRTFLRGGAQKFLQNVKTLEENGKRANTASRKEKNLQSIQTILANRLPTVTNLQQWNLEFRDYQEDGPPKIHSPLSFIHDPVSVAAQKARDVHLAKIEEEIRAKRMAALEAERLVAEEARRARTIAVTRAKTRRRFRNGFALILAAGVLAAIYARWEAVRTRKIEEKTQITERETHALREETEQTRGLVVAAYEADIERLIGEVAAEAVEEGLKNQKAIGHFVESGDGTLLYQAITAAFSEKLMGSEWIRMTEMRIDMILEEEGVGPPYLYTLEVKYSVEDKDRGVIYERALVRRHVPLVRVPPVNPARRHGKLPVKVGH